MKMFGTKEMLTLFLKPAALFIVKAVDCNVAVIVSANDVLSLFRINQVNIQDCRNYR